MANEICRQSTSVQTHEPTLKCNAKLTKYGDPEVGRSGATDPRQTIMRHAGAAHACNAMFVFVGCVCGGGGGALWV
eukprot:SAG11_NODE_787_length_7169_cov_4.571146_7_plen_76_part_00